MIESSHAADVSFSVCRDRAQHGGYAEPDVVAAGAVGRPSSVAYHEAGHIVAARCLGLPLGGATIVAEKDFAGRVFGPECDLHESAAGNVRTSANICAEARASIPKLGELRDSMGVWLAHAQSTIVEFTAGRVAEKLAGFDPAPMTSASDRSIEKLYAATVCLSDAAISAFISYAEVEARGLLEAHWHSVTAIATALENRKTLTGAEIDEVIYAAEQRAENEAELKRRKAWAAAATRAAEFMGANDAVIS